MPDNEKQDSAPTAKKLATEKVTLKKEHTHRRQKHKPGDQIDVTAKQKERLKERDII